MDEVRLLAEQQLIKLARKGEMQAINLLISRYQQKIFLQIKAQVNDHATSYDLTQEVNIKIFRSLPRYRAHSSFSTWLYKITQNTVKNYFRALHTEIELLANIAYSNEYEFNSPESYLIGLQLSQRINKTFQAIPQQSRDCFHLYLIKGLCYEEIAKHLGCPLGTVRSRIHRVKLLLLENFKQDN